MRRAHALCPIVLLGALFGCRHSLDDHEYQDAAPIGRLCTNQASSVSSCAAAVGHAELGYIQSNIITPKCSAFSSCHGSVSTQDMLDLSQASGTLGMVDATAILDPSRKLVVAGDINKSFLSVMIGAIKPDEADPPLAAIPDSPSTGKEVGTMPQDNPVMCCEKIDAVTAWIMAGAPNN
ncbi:MAG TPA: hypothetical protein VGC41_22100 [Kofleriaceae bacterium]